MPERTAETRRELVLVVGVGRSGTSLCTGILGRLGYRVPQPEMEADETNPRGFSEPRWVVEFHRRLMRKERISVFDSRPEVWEAAERAAAQPEVRRELETWLEVQFVGSDRVVVKDPRITYYLPLWERAAGELGLRVSTVTMLRPPPQVLRSARTWYGTWQTDASRAVSWVNGMLGAEWKTRGLPRRLVRYDDLLADWRGEIRGIGDSLGLPDLVTAATAHAAEVDALVDPSLQRSRDTWSDLDVPATVVALADRLWEVLGDLSQGGEQAGDRARLDRIRAEYAAFYREAESIAQSSVTAVKPRKPARQPAAEPRPVPPRRAGPPVPVRVAGRLRQVSAAPRLRPLRRVARRALALLPPRTRRRALARLRPFVAPPDSER